MSIFPGRPVFCLLCLHLAWAAAGEHPELRLFGRVFSFEHADDFRELAYFADSLAEKALRQKALHDRRREAALRHKPAGDMTLEELKQQYAEPSDFIGSKERRGLEFIHQLALEAAAAPPAERAEYVRALLEVADAISNNRRSPMPRRLELSFAPFILMEYLHRPVGVGRARATNLREPAGEDLSLVDPVPGTIWRRPSPVSGQDLYAGFGRARRPRWETNLWTYAGPKTSFGTSPGFEAEANGVRIKVKFRETVSEPFTARIFSALGYHVDPTDHATHLKIKYDRRLLKEFHLRKDAHTQLYRFGIPVMRISYQTRHDPLDCLNGAVLKDGTRMTTAELRRSLFQDASAPFPEDAPGNFREVFEREIDYLITVPANVQPDNTAVKSIGPWDFSHLEHAGRRELRGVCLLAAWLGWCDARFDNTRLKLVKVNGRPELRHYFSDLGGGLGKGTGFIGRRTESPAEMSWRVTRPAEQVGRLEIFRPFRIVDYTPVDDNAAFEAMTFDDARWMARLLGQLTRRQILDALEACDLDTATVELYAQKLVTRRDHMIRDLKLERDLPLLDETALTAETRR